MLIHRTRQMGKIVRPQGEDLAENNGTVVMMLPFLLIT